MRPPILAAVMLTCACASSSPEPAAAPTPALDSAALARATPHALVNSREQYYDIDGSSAGALRNQISRLGPKDESGTSQDALTVWSIESGFNAVQQGDSCVLRDVKVTLDVAVTLPRWKPPATATAQLVKRWQTYLKAVRLHEAGHRTIAERNAREVMAALTPLRGTNCDKLSDEATRTAERIVADGRARNRAYDVQTKHGQTQGVELGP
jgi:predicted secreted Zn-dependent protease